VRLVKWKLISVRLEKLLSWPKIGARFEPNVPRVWKSFWPHPMDLLGDVGQMEACFGLLEIVLISTQERCMVCTKCAIGLEIILGAPFRRPM
jgi:hypothetical protein